MDLAAVLGLAAVLFIKEAGVPIPVPGDLLVLGAGVAAAGSALGAPVVLAVVLAAGFLGGSVQFLLVRGTLREPLLRLLARFGVPRERLDQLAGWLRRRGGRGVAVARATPGLRVGAIAASGLAALPFATFLPGLVAGNSVFVGAHFALGFVVGPPALDLIAGGGGLLLAGGAFVALAILGAAGWAALRARGRGRPIAAAPLEVISAAGTWAEAACPACLAVSLLPTRGATPAE